MKINKNEKKNNNHDKNKIKNKIENYENIIFNNWKKKEFIEENTNSIITKENDYPVMSYCMWINVQNYYEKCSINENNNKNEKKFKVKDIKIYICIVFDKIFLKNKINIILNKNINTCKLILFNIINYLK